MGGEKPQPPFEVADYEDTVIDRLGCRRIALEEGRLQEEIDPWQ